MSVRAAAYVRISDDRLGDEAGVARQEKDCRALAERHGWEVTNVYVENDKSAFHQRRVQLPDGKLGLRVLRPAFRQMLDDLSAGVVGALVGYDLDRVARDPRDLEDLIEAVKLYHFPATSVTGSLDLSTDAGVTMARVMVAFANKASLDTSRRVARKHLELAEQGKSGGGGLRAYGYTRTGEIVDAEARVIRELAERLIAGEALTGLAKDLTARGVATVQGGPWNARSVHSVVTKARNAGLREYRGEVIAAATWPAVFTPETLAAVRLALAGRAADAESMRSTSNRLRAWLTGVLRCGRCGHGLSGAHSGQKSKPTYMCKRANGGCGHIVISRPDAEAVVEGWILAYLDRPDVLTALSAAMSQDSAQTARDEAAKNEAELMELADMWSSRRVTTGEYLRMRKPVEGRLRRSRDVLRASSPGSVRLMLDADDRAEAWAAMLPWQKRDVAHTVFPHGITVAPSRRARFQAFDPDRLTPATEETP